MEEEGGTIGESSMETYTLHYIKYIGSGSLLYNSLNSNQDFCNNLEGWESVGGGREILETENISIPMANSF